MPDDDANGKGVDSGSNIKVNVFANQPMTINRSLYDHATKDKSRFRAAPGLSEDIVREISRQKNEPAWMLEKRLKGLELFQKTPLPNWGPSLSNLNLDEIVYFIRPDTKESTSWDDVPADIKKTFDRLGIPEAEKTALAGVGAQYDSDVVYHNIKENLRQQGVIFENMDVALQQHPELVQKYFMTQCIPINDHKFIMLHAAVWSGGTFIYVPKGVKVDLPLQAYFRMNAESGGQFEHTLIITDEGSDIQYIEGCFIAGTTIVTSRGRKPIENIAVGDRVFSHEGKYRRVCHTQKRKHTGKLYRIRYYGDSTEHLTVTEEHPFLCVKKERRNEQNRRWRQEWKKPPEMKALDYLAVPIDRRIRQKKFHSVTVLRWNIKRRRYQKKRVRVPSTPVFFRLVGYYLAEGSISSGAYLNFSFANHETLYMDDVEALLKQLFRVKKVHRFAHKTNHGISLVVCSTELSRIFSLFGTKNNRKNVPDWMMIESYEKQAELIKGYFRGDGNYYSRKHKSGFKEECRMNTTSELLARQVRDMLLRLGVVAFINKRNRAHEGRQTMYTVGIGGRFMEQFGKTVGLAISGTINGKRRASPFYTDGRYAYYPIRSISYRTVRDVSVYNFSVENDESYIAGGVAVHNCSAPRYSKNSLHAGCVEIFVHKDARVRYYSIENWSKNTYNLNTKRALVDEQGVMEWINGNMGSGVTMLYPCSVLRGRGARSDSLGVAFAGPGQNQDTGSKAIHAAPETKSTIKAKSISAGGGISTYRGLVKVTKKAEQSAVSVQCDALLMDAESVSNTHPCMKIDTNRVDIAHEARVGKIGDDEIFYLTSRGLSEEQAMQMVVAGFIEPVVKALPLEYALELNKLIELEMEGAVG